MNLRLRTLVRLPKLGHSLEECEDRAAVDLARGILAVSDGASTNAFPGRWAGSLVQSFLDSPSILETDDWLSSARARFIKELPLARLPWHALEKLERGAFATLVGLWVDSTRGVFSCLSVGDSLACWVLPDGRCQTLPTNPSFGHTPYLLSSLAEQNLDLADYVETFCDISLVPGTVFYLMTDAIGDWFFEASRRGQKPWRLLRRLVDNGLLERWLNERRKSGLLRNDDVTLIILGVDS